MVLVNKMDQVNWSEEKFNHIKTFLSSQIGSMGFDESNLKFIPTSGSGCQNIKVKVGKQICPWYDGDSLIQALNHFVESNNGVQLEESSRNEETLIKILDK